MMTNAARVVARCRAHRQPSHHFGGLGATTLHMVVMYQLLDRLRIILWQIKKFVVAIRVLEGPCSWRGIPAGAPTGVHQCFG